MQKLLDLGAKPLTLSDSAGYVYDEAGIDRDKLRWVMDLKNVRRGRIEEYAAKFKSAVYTPIDGKDATTIVTPRQGGLVEAQIETGRTHQIRRHLSSIGHPIAGDLRYGSMVKAPRLMLHAWRLEHAELGTIEAPVPSNFL